MTLASPSPTPRGQTRQRLIDAAFVMVAREGFEGATIKAIAAEAAVTPGVTHYHFPTREALLEAALRQALETYLAESRARREGAAPERQIEALFAAARAAAGAEADFFRVRLAFAVRALNDPGLAAVMRELNTAAITETARTLAAARGMATPDAGDRALAATLASPLPAIPGPISVSRSSAGTPVLSVVPTRALP